MAARRTRASGRSKTAHDVVSEVEELLDRLRADLADLADQRARGRIAPEIANRLFRSAHTLKGVASMSGLEAMGRLAHRLEDVLDGLRMDRLAPDAPALDLLEPAVGVLADELEAASRGGRADPAAVDGMIARVEAALAAPGAGAQPARLEGLEPDLLRALTEYEEHRLAESLRRGRWLHVVEASFDLLAFEEGLAELSRAARDSGEVIATLPAPGDAPEAQIRFLLLVAADCPPEALSARIDSPRASVRCLRAGTAAAAVEVPPAPGEEAGTGCAAPAEPPDAPALESLKSISDTVRVDIRKLDELMNLVGELVIQRGAVGAIAERLLADPAGVRLGRELAKVHKALDRKLQELQAGVLEVRMVPLRQVFEKLTRVVRRLLRDSGRAVRLEIRGGDTELDKLLVEELADPLMHVVRNAFDHAIEPATERVAAGKPAEGTIAIAAHQRGNHVVIEVSDDGRGIDVEAVRARATALGLLAPDAAPGRRELLELIFLPGLSTRDEVTETSGRGVGMDVVRENVTALGGLVQVDSWPGRGTGVSFTLPITLAIIRVLTVGVAGQRFAIPLTSVLETLLVGPESILRSEGRELLNLRGEPLPLRRLHAEFGLPEPPRGARGAVVVVGIGEARLGLYVDRLESQQDAVIKPIQGPVRAVRGIAGASELGDLGTVLVLDVAALVEDAGRRREAA